MHPARSNESPFTTSPKILVHLDRHFHSNLSLQSHIQLHISTALLYFPTVYIGVHSAKTRCFSLSTRCYFFNSYHILSTRHSSRPGWCRLASRGPGKPYTHDTSPAHANSLSVFYLFILIASTVFLRFFDAWHTTLFVPFLGESPIP